MQRLLIFLTLFVKQTVSSQLYLGGFIGAAGYNGDLNEKHLKRLKPSAGINMAYGLTNRFNFRMGILIGGLQGGDEWSGDVFIRQNRNLSFSTDLTEINLMGELSAFSLNKSHWTPYVFGGVALFHFNPYVIDSGEKLFLKPLSTEGQGLSEYPESKPYSLWELSIPFGGGVRFVANEKMLVSFELGLRRTMTDYLDDVSSNYVDQNVLLQHKGLKAVQFSYRADEVPGGIPGYPDNGYPANGTQRGSTKYKDWYYIASLNFTFRFSNLSKKNDRDKKAYGCN